MLPHLREMTPTQLSYPGNAACLNSTTTAGATGTTSGVSTTGTATTPVTTPVTTTATTATSPTTSPYTLTTTTPYVCLYFLRTTRFEMHVAKHRQPPQAPALRLHRPPNQALYLSMRSISALQASLARFLLHFWLRYFSLLLYLKFGLRHFYRTRPIIRTFLLESTWPRLLFFYFNPVRN